MRKIIRTIVLVVMFSTHAYAEPTTSPKTLALRFAVASLHGKTVASKWTKATSKSSTNFAGGWHGSLVLARATCSGFNSSFLFRHVIQMSGNRVAITTSHDGNLYGLSSDKGKRLLVGRTYSKNGIRMDVAVAYSSLKGTVADLGYGLVLTGKNGQCIAAYRAKAIRAFY